MHTDNTERGGGSIWSANHQLRPDGVRDLSVGIAGYGKRRKPVNETTTVPEIPKDAA